MKRWLTAALVLTLGGAAAAGCDRSTEHHQRPAPSASARLGQPGRSVTRSCRADARREARALVQSFGRLEVAATAGKQQVAWREYLEIRRKYRALEPEARLLAPMASSQIDPPREPPEKSLVGIGLRALGDALLARNDEELKQALTGIRRPVALLERELTNAKWDLHRLGIALSDAAFEWGRLIDGSKAEDTAEHVVDVQTGGRALVRLGRTLASGFPEHRALLERAAASLEKWLESAPNAVPQRRLDALLLSARLGAAARKTVRLGLGQRIKAPFLPLHQSGEHSEDEAVSVASFPRLKIVPPKPELVALGKKLFHDKRLSSNQTLACSSCHLEQFALSGGPTRHKTVQGKLLERDAPGLWNTAYEPAHFWDSRAATLERQIDIAIERDMNGDYAAIAQRLSKDERLKAEFARASAKGITKESVRDAIGAYERTLVRADTPFDRYVRGDAGALDAELMRGFDVFYGKARCSRCHLLPLTSGTEPPRFREVESSAIGVPVAPERGKLDPDRGLGGVTKRPQHDHAFKVPTLRDLARTAPYFHNASFQTLEQVVDFYRKGSGLGLGIDLDNFDPDAGQLEMSDEERRALLAFLRRGLLSEAEASKTKPPP